MKYLIAKTNLGHFLPVVFDEMISHSLMWEGVKKCFRRSVELYSAGFVTLTFGDLSVLEDPSESLDIGPKPGDSGILSMFLHQGMSGLDLMNHFAYLEIQARKAKDEKEADEQKPSQRKSKARKEG